MHFVHTFVAIVERFSFFHHINEWKHLISKYETTNEIEQNMISACQFMNFELEQGQKGHIF